MKKVGKKNMIKTHCPKCGNLLIASPVVLASNPPIYVATCVGCKAVFHSHNPIGIDKEKVYNGNNNDDMWELK